MILNLKCLRPEAHVAKVKQSSFFAGGISMTKLTQLLCIRALLIVLFFVGIESEMIANDYRILMIGNSYTKGRSTESVGGTSNDLQGLFDADLSHTATVVEQAVGSYRLVDHLNDPVVVNLITDPNNIWDVIVLQEQSELPAKAMKFGGPSLNQLKNGGPEIINLIKQQAHLQQTSVVLFNTWSRALGEETLLDDYNNEPHQMQNYLNSGYDYIQENSPVWNHSEITSIARVGVAWENWYDTYGYNSSAVTLHDDDGSHQNGLGSYLTAAVIYETITGKSTIGNSFNGTYQEGVSGELGGVSKLFLLQQRASATTGVAETGDFDQDGDVDGRDFLTWQRGFGSPSGDLLAWGDGNLDGIVDSDDMAIWQSQFGNGFLTAFSTVPEPDCIYLLCLTWSGVLWGCRNFTRIAII